MSDTQDVNLSHMLLRVCVCVRVCVIQRKPELGLKVIKHFPIPSPDAQPMQIDG